MKQNNLLKKAKANFKEFITEFLTNTNQSKYTFDSIEILQSTAQEMGYDISEKDLNIIFPKIAKAIEVVNAETLHRLSTKCDDNLSSKEDKKRATWGKSFFELANNEFSDHAFWENYHINYMNSNLEEFKEYYHNLTGEEYDGDEYENNEIIWDFFAENGYPDALHEWVYENKSNMLEKVEEYLECDIKITIFNDCEPELLINYPWNR